MRALSNAVFLALLLAGAPGASAESNAELADQVRAAETAFAASLPARDLEAFASLVAEDAIFFGRKDRQIGKAAVVEGWKPLFDAPSPPFSWKPEVVEVLASGTLGLSSGPVYNSAGKQIGTFNSIWRREPDGRWLVVFDKGCPVCDTASVPATPGE